MTWDRGTAPEAVDVTRAWIEHHLAAVHTAMPCRVQSYDAATQTADLVPLVRHPVPQPDGTFAMENLPVLPCVPVVFPRTVDHFIAFAVAPGDHVLAVFCEGAIGHWWAGDGDVTDPGDLGRHHLSSAVCFPGLYPNRQKLAHAPSGSGTGHAVQSGDAVIVSGDDANDGVRLAMHSGGALKVTHGADTVAQYDPETRRWTFGDAGLAQFVALANLVDARLSSIRTWLNAHQHVETGATTNVPATPLPALDSVAAGKLKTT